MASSDHVMLEIAQGVACVPLRWPNRRQALSGGRLLELRGESADFHAGYDLQSAYARYAAEGGDASPYCIGSPHCSDFAKIGRVLASPTPEQLQEEVAQLAPRLATVDPGLLATHKDIVENAMERTGAEASARLAAEMDSRAHLTRAKNEFDPDAEAWASRLRSAVARRLRRRRGTTELLDLI